MAKTSKVEIKPERGLYIVMRRKLNPPGTKKKDKNSYLWVEHQTLLNKKTAEAEAMHWQSRTVGWETKVVPAKTS